MIHIPRVSFFGMGLAEPKDSESVPFLEVHLPRGNVQANHPALSILHLGSRRGPGGRVELGDLSPSCTHMAVAQKTGTKMEPW